MTEINKKQVVVRFPPSPTGEWHFGNVRTFVFNYLFARNLGGKIVMRFEDTDKARNKPESYQQQLDTLKQLGMDFDDGPYRQSERTEIYRKYLKELVDKGIAYEGVENLQGTGKIIRLKNLEKDIVWTDLVKGEIKINTHSFKERDEEGDFVGENPADIIIARSIDDPIYHFTVVVDDWLMGITHVLRGDDHVTSTPRQILIYEALDKLQKERGVLDSEVPVAIPEFGHLPTILGSNGKKMGKRNGALPVRTYFDRGYLANALLNFIALMGWNPGGEQEVFSKPDLIKIFSLKRVQKNPANFDENKLDYINKAHLKFLSEEAYVEYCLQSFNNEELGLINANLETNKKVFLKVLRERVSVGGEVAQAYRTGEVNMFFKYLYDADFAKFDLQNICFKNKDGVQSLDQAKANLKLVLEKIEGIGEREWTSENLKNSIWDWSATVGRGTILHPLRMVMSLKTQSPDPFTIMDIVGKEESLRRIKVILA